MELLEIGHVPCKIIHVEAEFGSLQKEIYGKSFQEISLFFISFLAEDKFSYCTSPSLHSLKVCYIQV
jgi:hypothetical protein